MERIEVTDESREVLEKLREIAKEHPDGMRGIANLRLHTSQLFRLKYEDLISPETGDVVIRLEPCPNWKSILELAKGMNAAFLLTNQR